MVLRMIVLTPSLAPTTTSERKVTQNDRERPKTMVANPKKATEVIRILPCRRIGPEKASTAATAPAPVDGPATSQPYPTAPTPSRSRAKIGSSAVAEEEKE